MTNWGQSEAPVIPAQTLQGLTHFSISLGKWKSRRLHELIDQLLDMVLRSESLVELHVVAAFGDDSERRIGSWRAIWNTMLFIRKNPNRLPASIMLGNSGAGVFPLRMFSCDAGLPEDSHDWENQRIIEWCGNDYRQRLDIVNIFTIAALDGAMQDLPSLDSNVVEMIAKMAKIHDAYTPNYNSDDEDEHYWAYNTGDDDSYSDYSD